MWTESAEERKLIQDISRDIIVQVAPEELDLFDELVTEYFEDPTPPDNPKAQKDDPLGFGIEETIIAVTPAAAAVANIIVNYLITEFIKITDSENTEAVRRRIKELFGAKRMDKDQPAPLTKEQLEHIKKLARKQAILFGVKPEKAEQIANALIGLLALS